MSEEFEVSLALIALLSNHTYLPDRSAIKNSYIIYPTYIYILYTVLCGRYVLF